jgi:spore coat protein H
MLTRFIYFFIALKITLLLSSNAKSQVVQNYGDTLELKDLGSKIENVINLYVSESEHNSIHSTAGDKLNIPTKNLIINGDTLKPEKISTRGQTTLYFRRKSFSFDLKSDATFNHGEKKKSLKKFDILSLSMDKAYCCNRLAFEMMEASKLFDLFYAFCDMRINGKSEGICMIIEQPDVWALKKKDSPFLIRRGYNHQIDKIKTGKTTEKEEVKRYSGSFSQIYKSLNKYSGEEYYQFLSEKLDVDVYMRWLAFNYFVRNGDYTDEVFFYIDPKTEKFSIIPWDYDDLFSVRPHEGNTESRKKIGNKLFFSTEDKLDEKIVNDPYLYGKYLIQLDELLKQESPDVLKNIFEKTYAELYPYYSDNEIISNSAYDLHKNVDLIQLKNDLKIYYNLLLTNRNIFLKYLDSNIK